MNVPSLIFQCARAATVLVLLSALAATTAFAQTVPDLQAGDTLTIVIPEHNSSAPLTVTIDEYNEVSLGVYGRVRLGGLSQDEAETALARHMLAYLRSTMGLRLNVETRGTLVFVSGHVINPGRYSIPQGGDIWTAIRTAGGAAETADLSAVVLQRGVTEIPVDVSGYLTRRNSTPLPPLRPGDLIFVSADPSLGIGDGGAGRVLDDASLAGKVFVMGAVQQPGMFDRTDGLTALMALALADGPVIDADLRNVRLITSAGT